jgi:hypothetical protein
MKDSTNIMYHCITNKKLKIRDWHMTLVSLDKGPKNTGNDAFVPDPDKPNSQECGSKHGFGPTTVSKVLSNSTKEFRKGNL